MLSIKKIALGLAALVVAVATPTAYLTARAGVTNLQGESEVKTTSKNADATNIGITADPSCRRLSAANSAGQDIFLSTADPKTYQGTLWQNINCSGTSFRLKFGERALVVADVSAETDCTSTVPTNGQWCLARALLNGVEGHPIASEPSTFAFDSVAGGSNNWQAHAFNRGWEVRCGQTAGCQYKFMVQTRNNEGGSSIWIDELAVHLRVTTGAPAPL